MNRGITMNSGENKRNSFKQTDGNPIILNFEKCRYLGEIHSELKTKFGLPEYYGENWDALWDCLRYLWSDGKMSRCTYTDSKNSVMS